MKKIFVEIYLMSNLGDDLFLDILAKKYPNCQFTINYLGNNYDKFIAHYKNVRKRKYTFLNKIAQKLRIYNTITNYDKVADEHDALIFIGGSIFREEAYHQTLYEDRMNLVKKFKEKNKPVFILGSNFGPIKTNKFYNDYKELFQLCDDVCLRDLFSYQLFESLPQVRYSPDIVFQMNIDEYYNLDKSNKKRVGFSIIDVRHKEGLSKYYDEYVNSTIKTIELLVNRGYECYLMSFCQHEGDLGVINNIKSHLAKEILKKVSTYEYRGNLKEAISLIASFNLMVAARFHANIIALLLNIGIMPIIYSQKTTNMLEDIKLGDIQICMNNLHQQYNEEVIEKSFNNKIDLEVIKNQSKRHFNRLNEFVGF